MIPILIGLEPIPHADPTHSRHRPPCGRSGNVGGPLGDPSSLIRALQHPTGQSLLLLAPSTPPTTNITMSATNAKTIVASLQGEINRLEAENKYEMLEVYELHKQVEAGMEKRMEEQMKKMDAAQKMIQWLLKENDELRAEARGAARLGQAPISKDTAPSAAFEIAQLKFALREANCKLETMEEELREKEEAIEEKDLTIKCQKIRLDTFERSRDILARETASRSHMIKDLKERNAELERRRQTAHSMYEKTKEGVQKLFEKVEEEAFPPSSSSSKAQGTAEESEESDGEYSDSLSRSLSLDSTQFNTDSHPSTDFTDDEVD